MADVKTVEELESAHGVVLTSVINNEELMTESQFADALESAEYVAVDHEFRTQWLIDNGYEVTRENLANIDLPAKA